MDDAEMQSSGQIGPAQLARESQKPRAQYLLYPPFALVGRNGNGNKWLFLDFARAFSSSVLAVRVY